MSSDALRGPGPLNILKMAPGLRELPQLEAWLAARFSGEFAYASTKHCPTRQDELLNGGSIYWVFANRILCRQRIFGFETAHDGRCLLKIGREPVPVVPTPRRAFQGWRYLNGADAPADLPKSREGDDALPRDMEAALAALGLF